MLDEKWEKIIKKIDFAFQPIITTVNGEIFAVEALIREYQEAGFNSIFELLDCAYKEGVLYPFDLRLRKKAIEKFHQIPLNIKLFYNLDNRIINSPDLTPNNTIAILKEFNIPQNKICFEISERNTLNEPSSITNLVRRYKLEGFNLAIDDFGTGIAGLKLLYYADIDFLKIDRFFINDIQKDSKKQLFVRNIVNLAHIMGIKVIAEGIETKEEFYLCKELEIDFIQGYFIQKPTQNIGKIKKEYKTIQKLIKEDKRKTNQIPNKYIDKLPTIKQGSSLLKLIKIFKEQGCKFISVIDKENNFLGIIEEEDIKELLYSPYGLYIAQNENRKIDKYIKKTFSVEKKWSIEKLLEVYISNNVSNNQKGIIVTNGGKYEGFIDANTIINLAYKKNLELAKNQNPLTKLPGNIQVEEFIEKAIKANDIYYLIYFDFDNFKPFNDKYGFRKGDRVIQLFANILREYVKGFIGHIGGDDFFVGFKGKKFEDVYNLVKIIQDKFSKDVISFYEQEDREKGYIIAKDRFGIERKFEFLTVSSFIFEVVKPILKENIDVNLGILKKEAKKVDFPLAVTLLPQ